MAIDYTKWEHGKKNLEPSIDKLTQAIGMALGQLGPVLQDYDSDQRQELKDLHESLKSLKENVDQPPIGELVSVKRHLETLEKAGTILDYKVGNKTFGDLVAEHMGDETVRDKKELLNLHLKRFDDQLGTQLLSKEKSQERKQREEEEQLNYLREDAKKVYEGAMKSSATALDGTAGLKKAITSGSFRKEPPLNQSALITAVFAARMAVDSERGVKSSLKKPLTAQQFEENYIKLTRDQKFGEFLGTLDAETAQKAMGEGHGGALEDLYRAHNAKLSTIPNDLEQRYAPTVGQRMEFLQDKLKGVSEEKDRIRYEAELRLCQELGKTKENLKRPIDCKTFNQRAAELGKNVAAERADAPKDAEAENKLPTDKKGKPITALQYVEALKKEIGSKAFESYDVDKKREKYVELLAARMAVDSKRGDKSSLKKPISKAKLVEARKTLNTDPVVSKLIEGDDERLRAALLTGHGGAAEDIIKQRVDHMDTYDPKMPARFKPPCPKTYNEAAAELKSMAQDKTNGKLVSEARYNRYIAYTAYLADAEVHGGGTDPKSVTEAAEQIMQTGAFKKFCEDWKNPEDMMTQVAPTRQMRDNYNTIWGRAAKQAQEAQKNAPAQQVRQTEAVKEREEQEPELMTGSL